MRHLLVVLMLAFTAGCATAAQQQARQMDTTSREGRILFESCWAQAAASPEGQELADLLPARGSKTPSMTLLTNKQVPTVEQAATLVRYHNEYRRKCQDIAVSTLQAVHPTLAAIVGRAQQVGNQGYAKLASREISWGTYADFSGQVTAEADRQWASATQQINSGLQAQHRQEMQQRDAAAVNAYNIYATQTMLSNQQRALNQNQQMINAMNQPRMTNCRYVGAMLNCSTF